MINILIVAKNDLNLLAITLDSISALPIHAFNSLSVHLFYSTSSTQDISMLKLSRYDRFLSIYSSEDSSIYSAMNIALNTILDGHILFLNCGDIILQGFSDVISLVRRDYSVGRYSTTYLCNTVHQDLSVRKNSLYVSRLSPRWYSPVFGMPLEHCGYIAPRSKIGEHRFDIGFSYCADYLLILNTLTKDSSLMDLRKLSPVIAPFQYGYTSQRTTISAYLEEIRVLKSSNYGFFPIIIGILYRFLRIAAVLCSRCISGLFP